MSAHGFLQCCHAAYILRGNAVLQLEVVTVRNHLCPTDFYFCVVQPPFTIYLDGVKLSDYSGTES